VAVDVAGASVGRAGCAWVTKPTTPATSAAPTAAATIERRDLPAGAPPPEPRAPIPSIGGICALGSVVGVVGAAAGGCGAGPYGGEAASADGAGT
jgi:hypothetical protein